MVGDRERIYNTLVTNCLVFQSVLVMCIQVRNSSISVLVFLLAFQKKRFGTGNSQTRDHTSFHHTAIKHDHLDDSDNFRSPEETLYMATGMAPLPYGSPI